MSWQEWRDNLEMPAQHLVFGGMWVIGFGGLHILIDKFLNAADKLTVFVTYIDEIVIAGAFLYLMLAAFISMIKRLKKIINAPSVLFAFPI